MFNRSVVFNSFFSIRLLLPIQLNNSCLVDCLCVWHHLRSVQSLLLLLPVILQRNCPFFCPHPIFVVPTKIPTLFLPSPPNVPTLFLSSPPNVPTQFLSSPPNCPPPKGGDDFLKIPTLFLDPVENPGGGGTKFPKTA